jgi:GLPGLI family protein
MKNLNLIILVLFSLIGFAQEKYLKISYLEEFGLKNEPFALVYPTDLFLRNDSVSLYRVSTSDARQKLRNEKDYESSITSYRPSNKKYLYYFKDKISNTITYRWYINFKAFYIIDKPIFKWKLTIETKEILGYLCQKANMTFRGREYTAYFSKDLQLKGGPWKFDGLPGIILEISSDDGEFVIIANAIETIESNESIILNPYLAEKTVSWEEYKALYNEKYRESKNILFNNNVTSNMPKMNRELLVEDDKK